MPKKGKSSLEGRFKKYNQPNAQLPPNERTLTADQHNVAPQDLRDMDVDSSQFNQEEIIHFLEDLQSGQNKGTL